MTITRRQFSAGALIGAASPLALGSTPADAYPARPVKLVVSWSPGGGADTLARQLQRGLADRWKHPVIIENKPGGDATIGIASMLQQPADGHTIGLIITSHAVHSSLRKAMPYDLVKDFAGVINILEAPNLLVVNPKLPVRNVQELIALGKTRSLNFAAPGVGGPGHLGGVMFSNQAGINTLHVPYPGGAPALTAVIRGDADFMFTTLLSGQPLAKAGQVRAIAITSARRAAQEPDLPTVAESGMPGFELVTWYGMVARAGTPSSVLEKIASDIAAVVREPALAASLGKEGAQVLAIGPGQFNSYMASEVRKWAGVVKQANIEAQ